MVVNLEIKFTYHYSKISDLLLQSIQSFATIPSVLQKLHQGKIHFAVNKNYISMQNNLCIWKYVRTFATQNQR